jgi:hypothetical protein
MEALGMNVVKHVFERMMIDEEWSTWDIRGFTWWGADLAQRVWTDAPEEDEGHTIWRLHARTDFLSGWSKVKDGVPKIELLARQSTIAGPVVDPSARDKIQLASSIYVHRDSAQGMRDIFALICSIQAAEAHIMAEPTAELLGVDVARSAHPVSGRRSEPDDMLNVISAMVVPYGERPSSWVGEEMESLVELLEQPPCVLVDGNGKELSAQYAFGERVSVLRVDADVENPRIGRGCLMRLTVPEHSGPTVSSDALQLNIRELRFGMRAPFLGSWCSSKDGLTFVSFLPNAMHRPGLLTNLVMGAVIRARWITERVYGLSMTDH